MTSTEWIGHADALVLVSITSGVFALLTVIVQARVARRNRLDHSDVAGRLDSVMEGHHEIKSDLHEVKADVRDLKSDLRTNADKLSRHLAKVRDDD